MTMALGETLGWKTQSCCTRIPGQQKLLLAMLGGNLLCSYIEYYFSLKVETFCFLTTSYNEDRKVSDLIQSKVFGTLWWFE